MTRSIDPRKLLRNAILFAGLVITMNGIGQNRTAYAQGEPGCSMMHQE